MLNLERLKQISTKPDFAKLLGVDAAFLTRTLYIVKPDNQYSQFTIDKKSGGKRIINAPSDELKSLQKKLSNLLLDCIDEINAKKFPKSQSIKPKLRKNDENDYAAEVLKIKIPTSESKQPSLSHGFVRERSIITNAMMHIGKKNVLNIDLENFFDSFNFGRVRGFFIKNNNFKLNDHIATVIAQIACYENKLPQGSPCSPVISNLITHSLDIKLAFLARKYKCTYTRYADDITFSTRKDDFPNQLARHDGNTYILGKKLLREIKSSGFSVNNNKTRIQFKNSRQDVTGLIVNKKPNTKKEYWRLARAKCNTLFKTGTFTSIKDNVEVKGNLNELEGQLNFIDHVDHYNRLRQKPPLVPEYTLKTIGKSTRILLSGREKTFSQFLYYRLFCGNEKPTILCEGKTDNIYLKSAISEMKKDYPLLADTKDDHYELLVRFVEYTKRTRFLLEIFGGADYLRGFIDNFEKNMKTYENVRPKKPVIVFLDNDTGPDKIVNLLQGKGFQDKITLIPSHLDKSCDIRRSEFIHITKNLYVIFTPRGSAGEETDIEYFFDEKTRMMKHSNGKFFNTIKKRDTKSDLSKDAFATHIIREKKKNIDFKGLKPLLDSIIKVINHYDDIK
ncbi:retron Ec67 family RNA-directed DNA polymerase/endonuclease [Aeromonas sp. sia0103]|uniref:retron Ec67 family RNA-directed DNA polymerase/endonuclease n=1 Tax=Aeromonas sp. sia0103 TaxID=2854782 RepID=UPI001C45DAF4|nr:retron Ec67 family RNA-directed DNA polymerase/endonuclease [Aeromonas sp. sia0103]MBV7596909.1 retron Ec67 family RNA-directed DNA polymerase/endonuclease [Aeromonas sp. sia0103]